MKEVIIIGIIALIITLFITNAFFRTTIYAIIGLIFLIILIKVFIKKYDETERAIILRLGKFNRIAGPGWSIVWPFFEKEYSKVDIRTKMTNIQVPMAFTRDDLRIEIAGVLYYQISNPEKAILNIESYERGLNNMIISETRNTIASMTMRELFAKMSQLNELVKDAINHASWKWGLNVNMVQIKGIMPPAEIAEAMQAKEIASQQLQAQKFNAEAKKVAIEAIGEAAKKLDDKSIMYLYLEALKQIGEGQSTKMIFPMQFMNILEGMKNESGSALTGLNISNMIGAMKDKILEAGN